MNAVEHKTVFDLNDSLGPVHGDHLLLGFVLSRELALRESHGLNRSVANERAAINQARAIWPGDQVVAGANIGAKVVAAKCELELRTVGLASSLEGVAIRRDPLNAAEDCCETQRNEPTT